MKPALGSDRTCRRSGKPRPALTGEEELHTSTDRILTTHAGSIPRGEPLGDMLIDEEAGKPVDKGALQSNVELRVSHVLEKQAAVDGKRDEFGASEALRYGQRAFSARHDHPLHAEAA